VKEEDAWWAMCGKGKEKSGKKQLPSKSHMKNDEEKSEANHFLWHERQKNIKIICQFKNKY
jgi:hypothetical protein